MFLKKNFRWCREWVYGTPYFLSMVSKFSFLCVERKMFWLLGLCFCPKRKVFCRIGIFFFWSNKILIETICKILSGLRLSLASSSHFNPVWCREKVCGSVTKDFHLSSGFCECLRTRKGEFLARQKAVTYILTWQAAYCVIFSCNLLWDVGCPSIV